MSSSTTDFIAYALAQPILRADEERTAAERKDFDLLVRTHLRLAVRVAYGFRGYGLPIEDLIAEASTGLLRAAERFDPNNPSQARFGTYARFWVRAAITEYVLHNSSLIKKGTTAASKKLFFAGSKIDDGSAEEVAERFHVRVADVLEARRRRGRDLSLNVPIGVGDEEREWLDILKDDAPNAEEALGGEQERALQLAKINAALATLSERERIVVLSRQEGVSLEALSQQFGVSRERCRQIHARAEEKIRELCGVHVPVPTDAADRKRARRSKPCRACGKILSLAAFNPRARVCTSCQEGDHVQAAA